MTIRQANGKEYLLIENGGGGLKNLLGQNGTQAI